MEDSSAARRIRVLLVDDHPMVREGTRTLLSQTENVEVVGATGEGLAACQMVASLLPDVLLLDVRLPDISGIEVARRVHAAHPGVGILVLTGYEDIGYLRALCKLGARGYLRKTASGDEIVAAIRIVAAGGQVLESDGMGAGAGAEGEALTSREREVLRLLVAGRRNGEIAETLTLSLKTAEFHVSNILLKLGARSRAEAIRKALERGLVRLDEGGSV